MYYAIELLFDPKTEKHIHSMFVEMHRQKIGSNMLRTGSAPHITLAVFKACQKSRIKVFFEKFARETKEFTVRFPKIGTFEGSNVVYLSPVPKTLSHIQKQCLQHTKGSWKGMFKHYRPENITFHCTVGLGLDLDKIRPAVRLVKRMGIPKGARVTRIALYAIPEKRVPKVRQLFVVPLGQ